MPRGGPKWAILKQCAPELIVVLNFMIKSKSDCQNNSVDIYIWNIYGMAGLWPAIPSRRLSRGKSRGKPIPSRHWLIRITFYIALEWYKFYACSLGSTHKNSMRALQEEGPRMKILCVLPREHAWKFYVCSYTVFYCIVMYCTILYCIVMYCIVLYWVGAHKILSLGSTHRIFMRAP